MSDHTYPKMLKARHGGLTSPPSNVPLAEFVAAFFRRLPSSLVLSALRIVSKKHGCEIAISKDSDHRVLFKHPKFAVEMDRHFSTALFRAMFSADPEILVGEGFMHGRWHVAEGTLEDVLSALWNIASDQAIVPSLRKIVNQKRFSNWQTNTAEKSMQNIERHYDAQNPDNILFIHMLGETPCYSSAIFDKNNIHLADAQNNKINIIVQELNVKKGDEVLDIGSGWGVLTRRLASEGCNVTGITLSREQLNYCNARATTNITGSEKYLLQDYRSLFAKNRLQYDVITCIEVLDHIGKSQFESFFRLANMHLKDDGQFFLQLIARPETGQTSGWIEKHIYPGGYIASMDEIRTAYESAGFRAVKLVHFPGSHYAQTLREWRNLLNQAWPKISSVSHFDEVFYRKWMFFLAYSISAFDNGGFCNYHLALTKDTEAK